jgi:murein DD-endopeptidase MepM/ murein hydrolase activator NlpD
MYPTGDVSQWFAENPKLYVSMGMAGHNGIDIVRKWGERMYAVEAGTIVEVKTDPGGYGQHLRLINDDCTREWTYGHCSAILVKQNQRVKEGELVAAMGNTGFVVSGNTPYWPNGSNITSGTLHPGTHLHLGLRLVGKDKKGWSYPGNTLKFSVLNYDNGYKGAIDPRPYLRDPKKASTIVEHHADRYQDKMLMEGALLLRKINL